MKMVTILFLLLFTAVSAENLKYICTLNHTVELEADKVVFFESPNYPSIMTFDKWIHCYINFTKPLVTEEKNKRFVFAFTNFVCGAAPIDCNPFFYSKTNFTSNFFGIFCLDFILNNYAAFQGFAYLDDWGDDCPLESVSRIQPFEFTDLTQILTIKSSYDPKKARKQSCLWQFKAPRNFGFKIVITDLNILNTTIFKVENSKQIIITNANAQVAYPYYSIDNYLKIYLPVNDESYLPPNFEGIFIQEFEAHVTLVDNFFNNNEIDCNVREDGNFIYWTYLSDSGYPNNARCTYSLTILPNTEVIARITKENYEYKVDVINYYYGNNSLPNIYGELEDQGYYGMVFSTDGSEDRSILWEFISDGSIQSQGFEIQFEIKNCSCANPLIIVPCSEDGISISIMNDNDDDEFYCGNLKCNFTIKLDPECNSQFISLQYLSYTINDDNSFNVYRIISNNTVVFEMTYAGFEFQYYMTAGNHNILEVITTLSSNFRSSYFSFHALNISGSSPSIILNETKPYYLYNFCTGKCNYGYRMPIELSSNLKEQNATIDIYVFEEYYWKFWFVAFYNDNNLFHQLNLPNCLIMVTPIVYKCKTNMTSLAIIQFDYSGTYNSYLLFQISYGENSITRNGCVFKNNIFNLFNEYENVPTATSISAMSNKRNSCKIFIYIGSPIYIKELWANPSIHDLINIYAGGEEKIFASIDSTESATLWRNLFMPNNIYVVEIPINSTIMITYNSTSDPYPTNITGDPYFFTTNITSDPYKTIMTSPYYGSLAFVNFDGDCYIDRQYKMQYQIFNIQDAEVQFTILNFDVLEPNFFYFLNNNKQINITSTLHAIIFNSSHVELRCSCDTSVGCNIRIMVETINPNKSITTFTPTISSTTEFPTKITSTTSAEVSNSFSAAVNYSLLFLLVLSQLLII